MTVTNKVAEELAETGWGTMKKGFGQILEANKPINNVVDFLTDGIKQSANAWKSQPEKEKNLVKAIIKGHTGENDLKTAGLVAGSFITASAAGRVITGGGVAKDRNGNTNIIGLPFI